MKSNSNQKLKDRANDLRKDMRESGLKWIKDFNLSHLSQRDLLLISAGLYWAEGRKTERTVIELTNADAALMKVFVRFLREFLKVPEEKIRLRIQCYTDVHTIAEIEKYWLQQLNLRKCNLTKTHVRSGDKSSNKKGACPYGTAYVTVYDVVLAQSLFGFLESLGGFTNASWQ